MTTTDKIGRQGERTVSQVLSYLTNEYIIFNNVLLKSNKVFFDNIKRSTQIDHIVVSPYGIFVIETKNYKGCIFGDMMSSVWTQVLYSKRGPMHYTFYSPVLQNQGHLDKLSKSLDIGLNCMMGMIVFPNENANLTNVMCNCCYNLDTMYSTIMCTRAQIFSFEQTLAIANKIQSLNKNSYRAAKDHVKYVNKLRSRK